MKLLAALFAASALALPLDERATCSGPDSSAVAAAKNAFDQAKIVPDVIPTFNPNTTLEVSYNGKQENLGNKFSPTETLAHPEFSFPAEPGFDPAETKYTLIMVDPDAPGPALPILSDFLHWIVSDAQASCVADQKRNAVAPYMLLTPLSIAPHRYTQLLYRQPPNYTPPPSLNYVLGVRNNFDLAGYVKEAGLIGPVAGNYMNEGLAQAVCAITPNCTQDGTGYNA